MSGENLPSGVRVFDDTEKHRYVIEVDGVVAGLAVYHLRNGVHLFVHTEINDDFARRGLGTVLVRSALDDVRAKAGSIVPICPFFAAFLERHPDYRDLVNVELTDHINGLRTQG